jgi:phosphohistidine phosphatase
MKRIHLLRHAKSSWDDPTLADHERPLSKRGEKACRHVAAWIAESGVRPQLVLCSTATRARRTLELVLPSLDTTGSSDGEPVVSFDAGLYHASADALLERVRELDMDVNDVLLVGHNPGLQDLALRLSAPAPARERIAAKLPTGALVTVELRDEWSTAGSRGGHITGLVLPREL